MSREQEIKCDTCTHFVGMKVLEIAPHQRWCLKDHSLWEQTEDCTDYQEKPMKEDVKPFDISGEKSRTYSYTFFGINQCMNVTIEGVKIVWMGRGHAFHRVWDGETMHLCHAPGPIKDREGNIVGVSQITWLPLDPGNPCRF